MEFNYTYESSVFFNDNELKEAANRLANNEDILEILQDITVQKYGWDDRYLWEIEYVADNVKKYIEEHYDISDGKTIMWLINLTQYTKNRHIDTDHYDIHCNYDNDNKSSLIRITTRANGEVLDRVRIFIDSLSEGKLEVAIYNGNKSYISTVTLYDKISSIDELNKYRDIFTLLETNIA